MQDYKEIKDLSAADLSSLLLSPQVLIRMNIRYANILDIYLQIKFIRYRPYNNTKFCYFYIFLFILVARKNRFNQRFRIWPWCCSLFKLIFGNLGALASKPVMEGKAVL